jgi:hypothetical protein
MILISSSRNSTARIICKILSLFWGRFSRVFHVIDVMDLPFLNIVWRCVFFLVRVKQYEVFDPGGGFLCFQFRLLLLGCHCTSCYHRVSYLCSLGEELKHFIQHHMLFMLYSTLFAIIHSQGIRSVSKLIYSK